MAERCFVLRSEQIRERAAEFVSALPLTDRPWEIVIRAHKTKRSLDQNALYWLRLAEIGSVLGYGADEMHEVFKAMFLEPVTVDLLTEQRTVAGSTRTLHVREFGEYLDKVEAWAGSNGIALSEAKRV